MEEEMMMIGELNINILEFIKRQTKADNFNRLLAFLDKHKITEEMIEKAILLENKQKRVYNIHIKGYHEALNFTVKWGDII